MQSQIVSIKRSCVPMVLHSPISHSGTRRSSLPFTAEKRVDRCKTRQTCVFRHAKRKAVFPWQGGKRGAHSTMSVVAQAGDDNEELPWERKEKLQNLIDKDGKDLPFGVYLLGSAIITIAAVGSIFEIINKNSIFGVLPPSNPLWLPILGLFGLTGLPSAGFLFYKAITAANADFDRQDKADGY